MRHGAGGTGSLHRLGGIMRGIPIGTFAGGASSLAPAFVSHDTLMREITPWNP